MSITQAFAYHPIFEHLKINTDIPMSSINDLVTDDRGYLWIATSTGLKSFNGQKTKTYFLNSDNKPENIKKLFLSQSGILWIITKDNALKSFYTEDHQFQHFTGDNAQLPNVKITDINEDEQGNIWLATQAKGIIVLSVKTGTVVNTYNVQNQLLSNNILSLFKDQDQGIWISTDKGLQRYISNTGLIEHKINAEAVIAFANAEDQQLWLATTDNKLLKYSYANKNLEDFTHQLPQHEVNQQITDIYPTDSNNLWLNIKGLGLVIIHNLHQHVFSSLSDTYQGLSQVSALWVDKENQLWIGSNQGELTRLRLDTAHIEHIHNKSFLKNNLTSPLINDLYRDHLNTLWIGTQEGLFKVQETTNGEIIGFQRFNATSSKLLSKTNISFVTEDKQRRLWIGTAEHGLFIFSMDRRKVSRYNKENGKLSSNAVKQVYFDSQQNPWLITLDNGIDQFIDYSKGFSYAPLLNTAIKNALVTDILQDSLGNTWIATLGQGLISVDTKDQVKTFNTLSAESLPNAKLLSLALTGKTLWIASTSELINFNLSEQTISAIYSHQTGIVGQDIQSMMKDSRNRLWIGTPQGLSIIDGRTTEVQSIPLNISPYKFHYEASYEDPSGTLYFGGNNGIIKIHNGILPPALNPPAPIVDSILQFKQTEIADNPKPRNIWQVNGQPEISFTNYSNPFSITFHSPTLAQPNAVKYQYRMLQQGEQWHTSEKGQSAIFNNIKDGDYNFQVRTIDINQNISPITHLKLSLTHPWWFSGWAYGGLLLILLIIIVSFYWLWEQSKKAQMRLLAQANFSEQQLQLALWSSGNEYWNWQSKGQKLQRNHVFLDYPKEETSLKETLENLPHPDDKETIKKAINKFFNSYDNGFQLCFRAKNKDGQWTWVLNRGRVVERDSRGKPIQVVGTVINIQLLKEREILLQSQLNQLKQNTEHEDIKSVTPIVEQSFDHITQPANDEVLVYDSQPWRAQLDSPIANCITTTTQLQRDIAKFSQANTSKVILADHFNKFQISLIQSCQQLIAQLGSLSEAVDALEDNKAQSASHQDKKPPLQQK